MLFLGGEELLRGCAGDHARNLQRGRGRQDARTTLDAGVDRTFVTALRGGGKARAASSTADAAMAAVSEGLKVKGIVPRGTGGLC